MRLTPVPLIPPPLLHLGDDHGFFHVWVLVVLGIVANVIYHAATGFGFLARRPLLAAAEAVLGVRPRLHRATLPLRGGPFVIEGIEIPGMGRIERIEADLTLTALLREEVEIARVRIRGADLGEGPGHPVPEPVAPPSDGRRYRIGAIILEGDAGEPQERPGPEGALPLGELVMTLLEAARTAPPGRTPSG